MTANLQRQLRVPAGRLRRLQQLGLTERAAWLCAATGVACYGVARVWPQFTLPLLIVFLFVVVVAAVRGFQSLMASRSGELKRAALVLESKFPELESRLLTAVEQQPDLWTGKYNLLQQRLLGEVSAHAKKEDWASVVPPRTLTLAWLRESAAVLAMLAASFALITSSLSHTDRNAVRVSPFDPSQATRTDYTVDPGDAQIERHQSLLVLARFHATPPRDVTLHWLPSGGPAQSLDMTKSLDDPVFAGHLASISHDGVYRLEFDGTISPDYKVTVYDLPDLVKSSIDVIAPSYTHREPQRFENASAVTVIEGSQVRLECRVNKPLANVELQAADAPPVPLTADAADPQTFRVQWTPERSRKWLLVLTDADGRKNRDPLEFQIDVVPNRRPELKPVFPGQDQRVSALQEIALESRASDDFGILSTGLVVDLIGKEPVTVPLTGELAGGEAHPLEHLLTLESYKLEPGEIVSYSFFADDHGPDGHPRRTMSDLFFLEIRPFEESYRQMEGAGGAGQSNMQGASGSPGQNLDKLIDLQKQIVTATWNLHRRDPDLKQPDEMEIVRTLYESQSSAHEQFEQLAETLAENAPADRIRAIFEQMSQAIEAFTAAQSTQEAKPLNDALQAARGAFQGLVRLRPTDHRIMQGGQSGGGGGGGGGSSQQQLEQLELSDDQNRYESEKSARNPAEASEQKESLAFLNRLKELSQRQQGLNQKLKEIEAELRTAQTEAEREELERQLKQLRDEQQEMLQDADALRNKMEQSRNSEKTADTRKQLEQTRKQLVDATESLKEGQLGQALSAGTRAERDLQKMENDFRQKSSAQLAESLKQLRNQAKDLAETQDKAAEELKALSERQDKSLRQRQEREKLAETFRSQRDKLDEALKSIRETVEAAEESEPLAAKKLYEAARQAQQQKTDQALTATSQLLQQGFLPEASQTEQIAHKGLNTLREGIEAAADSVLGDELADLKRAKQELAELSQQLQQEMAAAKGEGQPSEGKSDSEQPGSGAEGKSDQPGSEPGDQPGEGQGNGNGAGESPSESPSSESPMPNEGEGTGKLAGQGKGKPGLRGGKRTSSPQQSSQPGPGQKQPGQSDGGQGGGPGGQGGPLTGGNYSEFVDRLRDVETLLDDPEWQSDVAKVREQARSLRADFKRHSKLPNWEVVDEDVRQPLVELQRRIAEEIARRESPEALVPTDRDPVPQRYREVVRKYYERLGGGAP